MSPGGEVVFGVLASVAGAVWLTWMMIKGHLRDLRRFVNRQTPRPIAEARRGEAIRIRGRVRIGTTSLEAPLSGRRCAAYHVEVESGETVHRENRLCDFLVEDESGTALVRVAGAELALRTDERMNTLWDALTARARTLVETLPDGVGVDVESVKIREGVLTEGRRVSVCGCVGEVVVQDGGPAVVPYREPPMRPVIEASDEVRLVVIDEMGK